MKVVATIITAFAAFAAARTTPAPGDPTGNPTITPALDEQVEAGKPFEITWTPTVGKDSTISLILLRGPSTNVKPLKTIVEGVPNNGKYTWNVPEDLENDKTHYGIQLIVDTTGQYQYTPQFGVSNPNYKPPTSGDASASASASASVAPTETGPAYTVGTEEPSSIVATVTGPLITPTDGSYDDLNRKMSSAMATRSAQPTDTLVASPSPAQNETETEAPSAPAPEQTGAASGLRVGLGMIVGAIVVAAAL